MTEFEGDDLVFYRALIEALPARTAAAHADHILRMLHSSPYSGGWFDEMTLIRAGLRKSRDPELQNPRTAADLISSLIDTLQAFVDQGGERLEEWFFTVLGGLSTHPDALVAFASYVVKLEPGESARARAPFGSDVSMSEPDDKDTRSEVPKAPSATAVSRRPAIFESEGDDDGSLSTGEVYE